MNEVCVISCKVFNVSVLLNTIEPLHPVHVHAYTSIYNRDQWGIRLV